MKQGLPALLGAQFFSAFADNAILFIVIGMVLRNGQSDGWYVPALQSVFLVAFVLLAPWVGRFADSHAKPRVMIIASLFKIAGVLMIILGIDALPAYSLIGVGAAIFGPAKYGVLPEMLGHDRLVKANGWLEGSTILAIISGTVLGARLADWNGEWALRTVLLAYLISIAALFLMPPLPPRGASRGSPLADFLRMMRGFFVTARARFSMLGASLFWGASAVLRVLIVAWAPQVLNTVKASNIAALTLYLAIGIIAGAALVPHLIPIEYLRRARLAAYAMSLFIIILSFTRSELAASTTLFCIGFAGGLFVVPINAALQEIGHRSIGSGGAVAIQNFFENLAMLLTVGTYTAVASVGAPPAASILVLGLCVLLATIIVSWHLPPDPKQD